MLGAMEDIYEEALRGYNMTEATAARIRGLIRDACDLEVVLTGLGIFVEALPQPPYGVRRILGRFSSMSEAQNFAWAWLTGPYGVVKDVCFTPNVPGVYGIDLDVLVRDIRSYLEAYTTRHGAGRDRNIGGRLLPALEGMHTPVWPGRSSHDCRYRRIR